MTLTVLGLFLLVVSRSPVGVPVYAGAPVYDYWLETTVIAISFSTVGAIITPRLPPQNPIGWIFCFIGVIAGVRLFVSEYAIVTLLAEPSSVPAMLPGGEVMAWISSWLWVSFIGLFVFLALLFPDGRLPSSRWRPFGWLVGVVLVTGTVAVAIWPETAAGFDLVNHPLGIEVATDTVNPVETILYALGLIAAASLLVRLRRSVGVKRQQVKWFAYAVAVLATSAILAYVVSESVRVVWLEWVSFMLVIASVVGLPVAVGIAILRYRLYNIDLLLNRTLVYGALTAVLAAVYFGIIVLFQALFRAFTGQESQLAVVVSTLAIAALFTPLRLRIQSFIDRRFYRRKYDARKTLEAFSAKLRTETDLDALSSDLIEVIRETMQPTRVSLWLKSPERAREATEKATAAIEVPEIEIAPDDSILAYLANVSGVVEVEKLALDSQALRAMKSADIELVVPLVSQGELIGLLNLGSRLSQQEYSADDRKLLSDLSTQAAPAVRVARLVRQQQEAETRYRTLVEQTPAITYVQEPVESSNPKAVTYISPQYETILGYPPESKIIDEEHWNSIVHPEDRERVLAEEARTDQTGEPFRVEYRVIAGDGRVVWVRDEATLVRDEEGQPLYWLGVQYDVTEQKREAQERERIEQELRIARLIQQTLLPKTLPELSGYDVAAYYQPAREVGGDFYDLFELEGGRLGLVVGDVTDKGIPAALVMATTRTMLRVSAQRLFPPAEVLKRTNEALVPDIPPNMFITCLYAILDTESGRLVYANAGHDPPYLRHNGSDVEELRARGMPLGLMPGMEYEEKEITLERGESVLFYSDGLVEAHDSHHEMFGFPKLQGLVGTHRSGGSSLIDFLLSELTHFAGEDWEQEDDITLVTLERSDEL
ncbi:MAG TPA: SpoIIE family protein phosphatase [Rubrobacter sp.]|nr:SpoIIE family protein phosphatase [Rubrobacter sp.]